MPTERSMEKARIATAQYFLGMVSARKLVEFIATALDAAEAEGLERAARLCRTRANKILNEPHRNDIRADEANALARDIRALIPKDTGNA